MNRVGDLILKELGSALQREVHDPRIGFVTLSRVEVSPDLAYADVFVSVLGSEKDEKDSMIGLTSSSSFLRTYLAKTLRTKTVPKLKFILDKGLDNRDRIAELLDEADKSTPPSED